MLNYSQSLCLSFQSIFEDGCSVSGTRLIDDVSIDGKKVYAQEFAGVTNEIEGSLRVKVRLSGPMNSPDGGAKH